MNTHMRVILTLTIACLGVSGCMNSPPAAQPPTTLVGAAVDTATALVPGASVAVGAARAATHLVGAFKNNSEEEDNRDAADECNTNFNGTLRAAARECLSILDLNNCYDNVQQCNPLKRDQFCDYVEDIAAVLDNDEESIRAYGRLCESPPAHSTPPSPSMSVSVPAAPVLQCDDSPWQLRYQVCNEELTQLQQRGVDDAPDIPERLQQLDDALRTICPRNKGVYTCNTTSQSRYITTCYLENYLNGQEITDCSGRGEG